MGKLILPCGYQSKLSLKDTQKAIKFIKDTFQKRLSEELNLDRVTAPLLVTKKSGLNDDLNGVERKVSFDLKNAEGDIEIVQSLAKWKRYALYRYGYTKGEGIYTDMNAIRRDDDMDNIHSVFVDQWDWERVVGKEERTVEFLKDVVTRIVKAISDVKKMVNEKYNIFKTELNEDVYFITSQELLDMYPDLSAKEREYEIVKKYKTVFIMQIGNILSNGEKHDGRAPDYDDWSLNGDIMFYNEILDIAFEISSMGIRVDKESLKMQLEISNCEDRKEFDYHKSILNDVLPLTIGGGIGQSRLCMLMLEKAHIGEVQSSIWSEDMINECEKNKIILL